MNFTKLDEWILFFDNILFTDTPKSWYINLLKNVWEDMLYWKAENTFIDYPGEYDINSIYIKVVKDADWKLNYYIKYWENSICIVQSINVLDNDIFQFSKKIFYVSSAWDVPWKIEKNEIQSEFEQIDL